jgi:predicted PhzF superfamily epimerase YddE/YHI9
LTVEFNEGLYQLNFPTRIPKISKLPDAIKNALNILPKRIYKSRDYVLVFDSEADIRNLKIDRQIFDQISLGTGGVIVTAKGDQYDYVYRFFTP